MDLIPAGCVAVPFMSVVNDVVVTVPSPGCVIWMVGACGEVGGGGGGVSIRSTITVRDTIVEASSWALTVIVFRPSARGTAATVQVAEPWAVPKPPRSVVQVTRIVPCPPLAEPVRGMVDVVACAATGCTVKASGAGGGGGGGAVASCGG